MDRHAPAGQWHGDPPGADGQFEGGAVAGEVGEHVHRPGDLDRVELDPAIVVVRRGDALAEPAVRGVVGQRRALDVFRSTAARTSAFSAFSSTFAPSWKSIARRALPSRLALKRPFGSSSDAPLANVIFT